MENLKQAGPMMQQGGANPAAAVVKPPIAPASGSGGSPSSSPSTGKEPSPRPAGSAAAVPPSTPTARPRPTPGRWRRMIVPRAIINSNTSSSRALPPVATGSSAAAAELGGLETMERWPWRNRPVDEVPALRVVEKGSREWEEAMERSNKRMLQMADELEQEGDEERCDAEEDKAAFRAFKVRTCRFYRLMANIKPHDASSSSSSSVRKPAPDAGGGHTP